MTKNYWEKKEAQQNREKLSWKEIDQKKDKSSFQTEETRGAAFAKKRMTSQAKMELEKLFTPKKSKEQTADWDKLLKLKGKAFTQKTNEYVEKYGLPKIWNDLLTLLDSNDSSLLKKILTELKTKVEGTPFHELDLAVGKLRILKLTAEDPEILNLIDECLTSISPKM